MKKWNDVAAEKLIRRTAKNGYVVTKAMRELADEFGYIDASAIPLLAKAFSRSKAEIHGVLHYYSDFRDTAPGRHILRICQAESCQAVGARKLTQLVAQETGVQLGKTSADGALSVEPVYCLGLCANGPAAELDGQAIAQMSEKDVREVIARSAS